MVADADALTGHGTSDWQANNANVAWAPGDRMDKADIRFGTNATLGYLPNNSNTDGLFTANDSGHAAKMALLIQYAASSFVVASDGYGTLVTEPPALVAQTQLTHPHV